MGRVGFGNNFPDEVRTYLKKERPNLFFEMRSNVFMTVTSAQNQAKKAR
jgi:hypothetical protein